MYIPKPFYPVEVTGNGMTTRVDTRCSGVVFGPDSLPRSVTAEGKELLAGPVRFVGIEDGEPMVWKNDYPDNESAAFIHSRREEEVQIAGSLSTRRFILNTMITVGYDGNMSFDLKVMPTGQTVAQVFGIDKTDRVRFLLERLWLEIPLKKEIATLFSLYPNSPYILGDGSVVPVAATSNSGRVQEDKMFFPFKPLFWLGNEERGLGFFAENEKNWQPASEDRVLEIVPTEEKDTVLLRVHLLDSHPVSWDLPPEDGSYGYPPLSFKFGLQATPVKPFPKNPYPFRALHLDCFIKVKGDYYDFLSKENRFDRLVEKGVTTLILHEKWNKEQNWFESSEYSKEQLKKIVTACHRRGISVLTYFGYEISSLSPLWTEKADEVALKKERNNQPCFDGGWYRVPYQRAYKVCYNNEWADRFVDGIAELMDSCHIDGVYLDGSSRPEYCCNPAHGCGWYDSQGNLRGTYPVHANRNMLRRLYEEVHSRNGQVHVHAFGMQNFTALPFIDMSWYGENLQFDYCAGKFGDVPTDYFRSEYTGRNMGVPVEFIAYENRPVWTFDNAIALSIVHGIIPRPNDIEGPLDRMSEIWKILDRFPVEEAEWKPYWNNGAETSDPRIKVSYYKYTDLAGKASLLVFCANMTRNRVENCKVTLRENGLAFEGKTLLGAGQNFPLIALDGYAYSILLVD